MFARCELTILMSPMTLYNNYFGSLYWGGFITYFYSSDQFLIQGAI